MGGSCSCKDTKKELAACEKKVKSLEQLISAYTGKTNNMKSSQTNLGILSIGVEQSTNENCECNGIWSILEIIAAIALFIFVIYLLVRFISTYCKNRKAKGEHKQRRFLELLKRETNEDKTVDLTQGAPVAARYCSREHLHLHDDL